MGDGCGKCCLLILAVFCPPLAVGLHLGCTGDFWINWLLTIFFYFPGLIHAWYVVLSKRRHDHCHDHVVVVQQPVTTVQYTTAPSTVYQPPVAYNPAAQPSYPQDHAPTTSQPPTAAPVAPSSAYPNLHEQAPPMDVKPSAPPPYA